MSRSSLCTGQSCTRSLPLVSCERSRARACSLVSFVVPYRKQSCRFVDDNEVFVLMNDLKFSDHRCSSSCFLYHTDFYHIILSEYKVMFCGDDTIDCYRRTLQTLFYCLFRPTFKCFEKKREEFASLCYFVLLSHHLHHEHSFCSYDNEET